MRTWMNSSVAHFNGTVQETAGLQHHYFDFMNILQILQGNFHILEGIHKFREVTIWKIKIIRLIPD